MGHDMGKCDDAVLCYVDDQWAWFTTQALEDQTGDG